MAVNKNVLPAISRHQRQFIGFPIQELALTGSQLQESQNLAVEQLDTLQDSMTDIRNNIDTADEATFGAFSNSYRERIGALSEEDDGFLGNKGRQIRAMAREFAGEAQPYLLQKQALDEARKAVIDNTTFTNEQRLARLSDINKNAGLKLREDGFVDRDSIFRGQTFTNAANFTKIADEAVKGIASDAIQGGYSLDPETGLLLSGQQEFVSQEEVARIAMQGIVSDPEAMSFIEDEVRLRNAQEPFQSDEEVQNFRFGLIQGAVQSAVDKYAFEKRKIDARNLPDALAKRLYGDADKQDLLMVDVYRNLTPDRKMLETPTRIKEYESMIADRESRASRATGDDKILLEEEIKDLRNRLATERSIMDTALELGGVSPEEAQRIFADAPKRPDIQIVPEPRIKAIEASADNFIVDIPNGSIYENNYLSTLSPEERQYYTEYKDWKEKTTAEDLETHKRIQNGLEALAKQNASTSVMAFPLPKGGDSFTAQIEQIIEGSPANANVYIVDETGKQIDDPDLVPSNQEKEWGQFTASPRDGIIRASFRAKNEEDEWKDYEVYLPIRDRNGNVNSGLEILSEELFSRVGTTERANESATARYMRESARILQFPDVINDLNTMPSGSSLYSLGPPGYNALQQLNIKGQGVRDYIIKRAGDRYYLHYADEPDKILTDDKGRKFTGMSAEDMNRFVIDAINKREG
jgi:hypothetical protein